MLFCVSMRCLAGFKVNETSIRVESALSFCVQENYLFAGAFKVGFSRASAELRWLESKKKYEQKKKTRQMNPIESHTNAPFLHSYFDFGPRIELFINKTMRPS